MREGKQPEFRVCPSCGARNKPKWEYCVRCSESLQDVSLGADDAPPPAATDEVVQDYGEGPPWGSIFGTLILAGMAFGVYQLAQQPTPAPPPELFTIGTVAPNLPPAGAAPEKSPGQEDYEQGVLRLNANDPAGAAALFARAAAAAPESHVFRHAYAVALFQSGEKEASIDQYASALRLSPENTTYRLNYAKALAGVGRRNDALTEYDALIDRHPGDVDVLRDAARLVMESDPARARDYLRRAVAGRPQDAVLKQQLASVLDKSGDSDAASRVYADILDSHPDAHISRGLLAEIHIRRGETGEAVALFRSGLQQFPDVPLLHRGLASALERSGATAEAIAEYREYVRLAPNAPDAQQLRERADGLEKRVASAS